MCKKFFLLVTTVLLLIACTKNDNIPENPFFAELNSEDTGITFSNEITPAQDFNIFNYRNFYNGGGVAVGDINNDSLPDLYFTANQGANRLYLNQGNFQFKDITESAGVSGSRPWTTGVTMADVNGDGLLDIYVLNSADMEGNRRQNELFINRGDLTFDEQAAKYNLDDNAFSVHASFFDYDQDGDVDCYLVNNSFQGTGPNMRRLLQQSREGISEMGGDKLLRNDNGVFTDVSQEAGIYQGEIGFGLGAIVGDVDHDFLPDIYVSNDFWERDYLYINQGDGQFSEELTARTSHVSQSSMGSDIGDINNDGSMDIFTTDMLPTDASRIKTMTVFEDYRPENINYRSSYHYQYVQNTLQLNNGNGTFSEIGFLAGVAATDWSWGALMFDFSNNGWKDIFVSNGIYRDVTDKDFRNFIQDRSNIARIVRERGEFDILDFLERLPSQKIKNSAFTNNGDKTFTHHSDSLGFYQPTFSNGAAYGDLDNDGDLDLVVNNLQSEASVFRNDSDKYREHNYLKVAFRGKEENSFGIGAHVTLFANGKKQVAQNMTSRSFQSSVPAEVHFGLGKISQVDSLVVVWPDHRMQTLYRVEANQKVTLNQSEATRKFQATSRKEQVPIIKDVTEDVITGDISHQENDYTDFDGDPLLPHTLGARGPILEEGDINGDGFEDLFITASLEVSDKLFLQNADGTFRPYISADIIRDGTHESTAAELLDIDSDGDLDLVVGNGGNQIDLNSPHNRLRAYENDGQGNFTNISRTMPEIRVDASTIKAEDFNGDGNVDLFVGARVIPKEYGADPRSYLFRNDGKGNLTDVTPERLKRAGMVTEAIWTDYDADGDNDLVVVGEWMPVMFFNNNNGILEFDYSLEQSRGWWNTIKEADLDGDGDSDYVLGNWGLNSKFSASPERPLSLHVNDFNNRGNSEYIITTYQRGDDTPYPFSTYQDLLQQMPFLKERIPDHHSYAEKTYEELFTPEEREGTATKQVTTLHTSILVNNGGEFELRPLPVEAQVSPVYGVIARDFNIDGTTDLLLLGNMHGLKPEVGRLANNYGVFLLNHGDLNYEFMPYNKTGVTIEGEVRDAKQIEIGGESHIIITRNDDNLMIFK
ncbi:VCBS repeat-containing protein [Aliifodinibius sp. S!AR15-10]|uniref:VCBS repeat-containing protein n=1 Tax=Aliifodinibius sp. S!AR15-10 TaxID=2950437 RepID=UPI002855E98E|nr:VCBS repeat-containing protein [Aliifodinibius sp. S!AR15-10]MDR8392897.1 VCBS repeat-containing protein [Aliifodinibius sp. S!AR15-10]